MQFCRGLGRKLSVPFVVLSILGWIIFVIGFAALNHTNNFFNNYRQDGVNVTCTGQGSVLKQDPTIPYLRASLDWFPHWCIVIVGPFVYICTLVHLFIGRFFTGIFTKFLTSLYLVTGGAVVYTSAVQLFSESRSGLQYVFCLESHPGWLTDQFWGLWPLLEFVGALAAIFFLTLFMMMWPLFSEKYEEYYEEVVEYEDEAENKDEPSQAV